MGPVVELLGKRRGQMFDMQGVGFVSNLHLVFYTKCNLGRFSKSLLSVLLIMVPCIYSLKQLTSLICCIICVVF